MVRNAVGLFHDHMCLLERDGDAVAAFTGRMIAHIRIQLREKANDLLARFATITCVVTGDLGAPGEAEHMQPVILLFSHVFERGAE